jgi:nitrogen regulatory protein PII
MYEVKAIVRLDRQEDVIAALHGVPDLPGLTVSVVEGVGRRQADHPVESEDYGRTSMAQIEIVVAEDRLAQVLDAVTRAAHTGRRGDGKVFVSRVERALRLRTGETDLNALQ